MTDHLIFYSGGLASWATAKRVAEKHGTKNLKMLFTDTLIEDADLYRFLDESAVNVGGELIKIADGRTPWEVMKDVRLLANSRLDPCSRILKREMATNWVKENYPDPQSVVLYIGMNWDEEHRYKRSQNFWKPYFVESPLLEPPYIMKDDMIAWCNKEGVKHPRLYDMGFPHNNCGGGCVKAGAAHFKHLLKELPEVYAEWEAEEEKMRKFLEKDVTILTYTKDNQKRKITLKQLRVQEDAQVDVFDWGGCGCFSTFDNADEVKYLDDKKEITEK